VDGEAEPIFFAKSSALSGGVASCVVSMNNESPPINLRAEWKKFCENMNTVALGIARVAFWKGFEQMKSQLDSMQWSPKFLGLG
jgi:dihydroorotase-like cyclic amidohydrolase